MNLGAILAPIYRSLRAEWRRSHPSPAKAPKASYGESRSALVQTVRAEQDERRHKLTQS